MAALTKERMTREERWSYREFPLAAGERAFKGGIAVFDASAEACIPGKTGTDLVMLGTFAESVDNRDGASPRMVNVKLPREVSILFFANSASDAVSAADIGGTAYLVDDQTVAGSDGSGTRSAVGTIWSASASAVGVEVK